MFRSNARMRGRLVGVDIPEQVCDELNKLVQSGFIEKSGCVFLSALYQPHFDSYSNDQFSDETGFEAFVNSIHIRDYCENKVLENGLCCIRDVFAIFETSFRGGALKACLSLIGGDAVLKFYLHRSNQAYLSDDIEGYRDPILECSNRDFA